MHRTHVARFALLLFLFLVPAVVASAAATAPPPPPVTTVDPADRAIGARLDARIATLPRLHDVEADVINGVALLHGEVISSEDLELAEAVATQTHGVKRVENRIALSTRLTDRFEVAMQAVVEKLVRLIAAAPLLLIAIAI